MYEFLRYIDIFQIVTDIYDMLIGSALVFGALKWRKGLLATTAFYWGLVLGFLSGVFIAFSLDSEITVVILTTIIGAVIFPILTYCIPAVNRFVLGFLVSMKLLYMLTTHLCKNGSMEFETAIVMPLLIAAILGLIFAVWHQLSVLPFALAYRKETIQGFKWLNENAAICDFDNLNDLLARLTVSVETTKEIRALFNSKHTHIFVAAFKLFTETGRKDKEFGKFLEWFVNGGNKTEIDGKSWDIIGIDRSTRDASTVHGKIDYLVALMEQYFKEIKKAA